MKSRSIALWLIAVLLVGLLTGCGPHDPATATAARPQTTGQPSLLSPEEAEVAAFHHAGLSSHQVRLERTELDTDDPILHYEVEFTAEGWEYDYEIHARTGEILKSEKKQAQMAPAEPPVPATTAPAFNRELASAIALKHAGLTAQQVRMKPVGLDADDPVPHYEVEFTAEGWEYEYEIHSQTGQILKAEKELAD